MTHPSASSEKTLPLNNSRRQMRGFSHRGHFLSQRGNGVRDPQREQNPNQKAEHSLSGTASIGADTLTEGHLYARADASFMDRFF
jgi:hypothetical protein